MTVSLMLTIEPTERPSGMNKGIKKARVARGQPSGLSWSVSTVSVVEAVSGFPQFIMTAWATRL